VDFSRLVTSLELCFKNQGTDYEILDHKLITPKSRDLVGRSSNQIKIMNYF
jgi:hypothetical protein